MNIYTHKCDLHICNCKKAHIPELFTEMERFVDARAGAWPAETITALAALAEECISYHARARPTAREVVSVVCGLRSPAT